MVISISFRDALRDWEHKDLCFDWDTCGGMGFRRQLIEIGCHFFIYGNGEISSGIDKFLNDGHMKEFSFDCNGDGRYFYVIRREKDF